MVPPTHPGGKADLIPPIVWSPDAQPQEFPGEAQTTPAASSEEKGALSSDIDPEAPFYK